MPVDKEPGGEVFAGTLNAFAALTVRVTSAAADSTLARVARLVSEAQGSGGPQASCRRSGAPRAEAC